MPKLTCVVVDDEELGRSALRTAISEDPDLHFVGEANDGECAIPLIKEKKPDLLFLDIEMPEMNGFELLDALKSEGAHIPTVVFVTAWDSYALKAFDAQAVAYLLKPFDEERFRRSVNTAKARVIADRALTADQRANNLLSAIRAERIAIRSNGRVIFLPLETIDWIEAEGNYLRLHTSTGAHLVRSTMQSFELRLKGLPFVRVHRSAIVNINRIRELQPWPTGEYIVRMQSGREVTMTRTYRDKFFEIMEAMKH